LANDKEMHPMSGDVAETSGVYQDNYGHEVELKAGDEFPMDPQLGKVDFRLVSLSLEDKYDDERLTDEGAAAKANIPVSAVNEKEKEARESDRLKHRRHGGER
jgi:hypothetical protein